VSWLPSLVSSPSYLAPLLAKEGVGGGCAKELARTAC
jgi:hypothetical protein